MRLKFFNKVCCYFKVEVVFSCRSKLCTSMAFSTLCQCSAVYMDGALAQVYGCSTNQTVAALSSTYVLLVKEKPSMDVVYSKVIYLSMQLVVKFSTLRGAVHEISNWQKNVDVNVSVSAILVLWQFKNHVNMSEIYSQNIYYNFL